MRRRGRASELERFVAPLATVLDWTWRRVHWWIGVMFVLYLLSGITIVKPGEVALVMRWGHVSSVPLEPGPAFLLPAPIDRVIRVPIKKVFEERVTTLADTTHKFSNTLDPIAQGYALTGDENIVHVEMVAHYTIKNAAEWAFMGPDEHAVIRTEVTAAMMRTLGEVGVDSVLADGRKDLIVRASRRAQAGLDAAHAGIELSSLELTRLAPPSSLIADFDAVQSAVIGATTRMKQAQAFTARAIPEANTSADRAMQSARGEVAANEARAQGETEAFLALDRSYRDDPQVVRERLYRDGIDEALGSCGEVRWVPPPVGARYDNFRISVIARPAGETSSEPGDAQPNAKQGKPAAEDEP